MANLEIKNAIITGFTISKAERNILDSYIYVEYESGGQGFGGYALYLPKEFIHSDNKGNYAGHWIFRIMEIAGVDRWEDLKGKTIRVKATYSKIEAIGHIVKDDWFCPSEDFAKMGR